MYFKEVEFLHCCLILFETGFPGFDIGMSVHTGKFVCYAEYIWRII